MDFVASEWIKLRSVRSTIVLLIVVLATGVGFSLLTSASIPADQLEEVDELGGRLTLVLSGVSIGLTLFAVLGVLSISQELRFGTIRVTFAAVPSRSPVVVAKAVVLAVVALAVTIPTVILAAGVGGIVLEARDLPIDFGDPDVRRALLGAVVLAALYALLGLAVGCIVRHQVFALVVIIVWPVVVEPIVNAISADVGKYLPFQAGNALISTGDNDDLLPPLAGGLYLAGFALVLLAIGLVLVHRRDA
jgi:ABC-2 type transport system permease protein